MMPELVPQTLVMDQQLELPLNWYGGFDGKRDISGPGSPANPDELLSSLGMVQNEWSFHGDNFIGEPDKGDGLDKSQASLFPLEDDDEVFTGLVSAPASQAAATDHLMIGSPMGQDDLCCDGWAELGSACRMADEERLCDKSFEDVFQVDSQDILCSPTLAQLNAEQDCSELLEDISNIIVKDEYGSAEASALASASNRASQGSPQAPPGSSVESLAQPFGQAALYSSDLPAELVHRNAGIDCITTASTGAWNLADLQPAMMVHAGAAACATAHVPPAAAQWGPEKRRRLSDSVTLYDLLISKSSPQQLQVMMNRGAGAAAAASAPDPDDQASMHVPPQCVLQHKRPRHAAAAAAAVDRPLEARRSSSSQASGCEDCSPAAALPAAYGLAAPTQQREPRRRRSSATAGAALLAARSRQLSECSAVSNGAPDGGDDDDDEGGGEGYTSDAGSCSSCSTWTSSKDGKQRRPQRRRRRSPYFWQYNSQSKGPRGERFELTLAPSDDPHKPVNFTDPVFDPEQHVRIRHVGRARKGDGNDVRPNPRRLVSIGKELAKLNRLMSDVSAPSAAAAAAAGGACAAGASAAAAAGSCSGDGAGRPDCKREKNKLASRACRLKKKAQHEANKVKLCGLEQERKELMEVLDAIKTELQKHQAGSIPQGHRTSAASPCQQRALQSMSLTGLVKELTARHLMTRVAGRTSQFVSEVVAQVEAGDPLGGLIAED